LIDGTYLHLSREPSKYQPSLRVVSLKHEQGKIVSERVEAPYVGAFQPYLALSIENDTLTLVTPAYKAAGLHFMRYRLDGAAAPHVLSNCLNDALDYGGPYVSTLGERIIVGGDPTATGDGPVMQEVIEVNTACETQREEYQVGLIDVPAAGVAIEVTVSDAHVLEARLRNAKQPGVVASAAVAIPDELEVTLRDNAALTDVVAFEQRSETERWLLGVGSATIFGDKRQLQLFSFSASTITARGALQDASRLAAPIVSGVAATGKDTFLTFDVDSAASGVRAPRGKIYLSPIDN
jgi:hypothetical protein